MEAEAEFAVILNGLSELRELPESLRVFGSQEHRFLTHPALSDKSVRDFEELHRIALPDEYRSFLLRIGNGGAGPGYGIFKLGELDDGFDHAAWRENDGFVGILSKPFPHRGPWNDLFGKPVYDESREDDLEWEDEYQRQLDAWENRYWDVANINGAIPICHLGCALRQWLVLTGPEAGTIWSDYRADDRGLIPVEEEGRARVTFLRWYRSWLDEALRSAR